jgi:hypothetical protein
MSGTRRIRFGFPPPGGQMRPGLFCAQISYSKQK